MSRHLPRSNDQDVNVMSRHLPRIRGHIDIDICLNLMNILARAKVRACGTRAPSCFWSSPPAASRSQPMSPEAHEVVHHVVDGLRATSFIG